jgi:1-deoxy-D-xylulose-5-phosphate reductoisomerase
MQEKSQSVTILGATGSIGRSAIDVLSQHRNRFSVSAVVGGRNVKALAAMARELNASFAAIADEAAGADLKTALSGSGIQSGAGANALLEAAGRDADIVIAGISGTAGLLPTYAAMQSGRSLVLANKECLVCAGAPFMAQARAQNVPILPLDSEHNALQQALGKGVIEDVARMTLTASGGPFRTWNHAKIKAATPDQALAHPTWSMGDKISIDSASLMNKGLELIEAHHLFGIAPQKLHVLVHPQSIVHGLINWIDGSITAGLAPPDMRIPLADCLGNCFGNSFGGGRRLNLNRPPLDLAQIATFTFEEPDMERFPCLALAQVALAMGGAMPTILNAANEIAVEAFLAQRIGFMDIAACVEETCNAMNKAASINLESVDHALKIDEEARIVAVQMITRISVSFQASLLA